jgi:prepilin-type N-terminal cleavage/methylation domain-containing protein
VRAASQNRRRHADSERGFTLTETVVAMLVMLIAGLGAASLFAYSVNNNSGAHDRDMILAVAQRRLEQIRAARFAVSGTDAVLNAGTTNTTVDAAGASPCGANQRCYNVETNVVDSNVVGGEATLKTIRVTVSARTAGPRWATGNEGAVAFFTQRSRAAF